MLLVVHHGTVKANNNSLGNRCRWSVDFSVVLARMCNNVRGHVAIITETESTYVMIESTLRFDDVEDVPGLLLLLRVVQRSRMRSRKRSGRQPGNEAMEYLLAMIWSVVHLGELHCEFAVGSLPMPLVANPTPATFPTIHTNLKFSCWKGILG